MAQPQERSGPAEDTGITPELLERLRPYLAESLMVLDRDWTVRVNLAPPGGLVGRRLWRGARMLDDLHPEDAAQAARMAQAFETEPGWQGSVLVRIRRGDGSYGRYEITMVNCLDDPVIGGLVVRTRELAAEAPDRWPGLQPRPAVENLAELLPMGVLLLGPDGRIVFANETVCGMLDREPESLMRDGLEPSVDPDDHALLASSLERVTRSPMRIDAVLRFAAGARIGRGECRFCSDGDDAGGVVSVAITIEDITQRWAVERDLEHRANHDPLTGLLNRGSLYDLLDHRIAERVPTTVAFLDLNGFKAVNDRFGHVAGDQLLVDVARALRDGLGPDTAIARLGGDEFIVVLDRTDSLPLTLRVHDLLSTVAGPDSRPVSCSVGIGHSDPADTRTDLLRRADDAMYEAKGRR